MSAAPSGGGGDRRLLGPRPDRPGRGAGHGVQPQRRPLGAVAGATRCSALGVFYVVQEAPFLGAVQIIVYTGAIMILFLFVLMLVGRDSSDSVVETLRGQRIAATVLGSASPGWSAPASPAPPGTSRSAGLGGRRRRARRQHPGDRRAAVHPLPARLRGHQRAADHRRGRRDGAGAHRARARQPAVPRRSCPGPASSPATARSTLPGPGVYARANSVAAPGLLPDGSVAEQLRHRRRAAGRRRDAAADRPRRSSARPDAALGTLDPAPLDGGDR